MNATCDLLNELVAAQGALREMQRAALEAAGVSRKVIALGLVGAARVVFEGVTYRLSDDGMAAFILPVRVDPDYPFGLETEDPAGAVWLGDLVDLVAFSPQHPHCWGLRRDSAAMLGAIGPQFLEPAPVPIWRTPLNWLRAGAVGLCPLTRHQAELQRVLLTCRRITAEDADHARELSRIVERPLTIPEITFAPKPKSAAA